MKPMSVVAGSLALTVASAALAGGTPLGTALGNGLGTALGNGLGAALGFQLGVPLPIVGGGLLTVAAASLAVGIWIVRRKKDR